MCAVQRNRPSRIEIVDIDHAPFPRGGVRVAFISVTRLRPRSIRFLPGVLLHSWRSRNQLQRARGFIGGYLAAGPKFTLWTVTLWSDEASMRNYRNQSAHLSAMPKLINVCDEAAVVHWVADGSTIPEPDEAAERMKLGRLSKVKHPSAAHAAGQCWPDGVVPKKGPRLFS
jgi:hypothetical protein